MGVMNMIGRLFGSPDKPRDDYGRLGGRFPELDFDIIAKRMDLAGEGRRRGAKDLPASASEGLDDIEQKVLATIDAEKKLAHEKLIDNLASYADRVRSLGLGALAAEVVAAGDAASADLDARVHVGVDKLFQLRRDVTRVEDDLEEFKRKHRLPRMAHYPSSRTYRWALVALLLLLECILNGTFLAQGQEFGLIGGLGLAAGIAFVNIAIGLGVGWFGLPNLWHRNYARKLIGLLVAFAYPLGVVGLNLAAAHYRDALAGEFPEGASRFMMETLLRDPLGVANGESWLLFALGIIFSLIALGDGLSMDDRYPGYGRRARKQAEVLNDYTSEKEDLIAELEEVRNRALERLAFVADDIERRRGAMHRMLQHRKDLCEAFGHHLDHLEHAGNYLLLAYRKANQEHRNPPPPKHFDKPWTIQRPPVPEKLDAGTAGGGAKIDEKVEQALESVPEQNRRIQAAYTKALQEYRRIEQLTPEVLRRGTASEAQE